MKLFEINYKKLVVLLLPTFLRKESIVAFLRAATAPVSTLHDEFTRNRNDNLFRLRMNGQRCHLRAVLNAKFPEAQNNIHIVEENLEGEWQYAWDEEYDPYNYLLLIAEEGTLFWNLPAIIRDKSGFTVVVPANLEDDNTTATIRSLVNNYKLLSKPYTIRYE